MKKANRDALLDVRSQWFIVGCSQHMMAAFSKYSVYLFLHVFLFSWQSVQPDSSSPRHVSENFTYLKYDLKKIEDLKTDKTAET